MSGDPVTRIHSTVVASLVALGIVATAPAPAARQADRLRLPAVLEPATTLRFPAPTDSNSPAFWLLSRGVLRLSVINSNPVPMLSSGPDLDELAGPSEVIYRTEANGNRWIESVVPDLIGRLYGYYHNEPAGVCADPTKTAPRIGAARSLDGGRTWRDLGIVLRATETPDCATRNRYFAGGFGDFSTILDRDRNYLYLFGSAYGPTVARQGVIAARMRWADRDEPLGALAMWADGVWRYPTEVDGEWVYPVPTPFLPVRTSWHDRRSNPDAFWGPSVHWNTHLERYVMLLNRARNADWAQEGIYITTTASLENPATWLSPLKLLDGGSWYPQVIGLEPGSGTDRLAGKRARFFMSGESNFEIVFQTPTERAVPR